MKNKEVYPQGMFDSVRFRYLLYLFYYSNAMLVGLVVKFFKFILSLTILQIRKGQLYLKGFSLACNTIISWYSFLTAFVTNFIYLFTY